MKKIIVIMTCMFMLFLSGCAKAENVDEVKDEYDFAIGICNYVDDASLNQIVDNIMATLDSIEKENGIAIKVYLDNCNADANVLNQIIANFIVNDVDLMIGVATPVAMAMQAATEDNGIPVIFAAVSDPLAAGLVDSLDAPGHNISGTSDFLDTNAVMELIFALKPEAAKIGLLYDLGQDASTTAIAAAKGFLNAKGVEIIEHSGTNVSEMVLAAQAMITDKVDAVFTPSDNTVMTAELSIYEALSDAGIPHFAGADSFALNGAFLGYGVDYANLGVETARMAFEVLSGSDISRMPVRTFDNGTATINTEICAKPGYDYDELCDLFRDLCTKVQGTVTKESFD
ncbi:MAG: ABC transporter substrate-binding protein [Erysipelotrichaceae bacterium]|nr:ABC transporter substrate-binding protein [Erysipelotrichaceae bacterium]